MISFKQNRKIHKWVGIAFLFPALGTSITAIMLALGGILGLDKVKINIPTRSSCNLEIKSMISTPAKQFVGTKNGLLIFDGDSAWTVPELLGYDIRAILLIGDSLIVASKQGLFLINNSSVKTLLNQEIHHVSKTGDGLLLLCLGKKGYQLIDFEGNKINETSVLPKNYEELSKSLFAGTPQTLQKLVIDLHTGEAIVGKTLKPYWIALCGIQLLLLTLTGLWYVVRTRRKEKLL